MSTKKKSGNTKKRASGQLKKERKFRPGTVAIRDIRKLQKSDDLLLQKAPLERKIREIMADKKSKFRIAGTALFAIQNLVEEDLTKLCRNAYGVSIARGSQTLTAKDLHVAKAITTSCL